VRAVFLPPNTNLRPQVQGKGSNAIKSQGPWIAVSGAVALGRKKQGRWQTAAEITVIESVD
jgi:hypothetical protein